VTWLEDTEPKRGLRARLPWIGRGSATAASADEERRRFEALTVPHAAAVYRTAYHLSGNAAEAEDLTQEAYLRAYRGFATYRGGEVRAWLLAIVRHVFLDECRKRGRLTLVELEAAEGPSASRGSASPPGAPSAESEALSRLPSAAVAAAFAALPPEWRLVVLLADVEERSYREIAEATGVPLGTVMSRLHRARKRMKETLLDATAGCGRECA
jgi:RNA polymerase sigma-70 factor (ECF subfamily)